ncbi:MAG TPA: hypothetical protein VGM68_04585 [Rhizomicrobium sp.]|jgi:hypothetical protein
MEKARDGNDGPSGELGYDGAIPDSGREMALYVKDMLVSLRRCAGAPYFNNLRALLLAAEREADLIAAAQTGAKRKA